jgi:hypothetical protein
MSENKIVQTEVYHKDYNLDKKENLDTLPDKEAVFGFFAIINEKPVHCRIVGETDNLQKKVREIFEKPEGEGMKKFMQGPWIKMLVYEAMPGSGPEDRSKKAEEWKKEHNPKIDDKGEYPK